MLRFSLHIEIYTASRGFPATARLLLLYLLIVYNGDITKFLWGDMGASPSPAPKGVATGVDIGIYTTPPKKKQPK